MPKDARADPRIVYLFFVRFVEWLSPAWRPGRIDSWKVRIRIDTFIKRIDSPDIPRIISPQPLKNLESKCRPEAGEEDYQDKDIIFFPHLAELWLGTTKEL